MGSVTERRNGSFQAKVRLAGETAQIKTFANKTDAKAWVAETESRMRRGEFRPDAAKGKTIGEAMDIWLAAAEIKRKKTEENRIGQIKEFYIPVGKVRGEVQKTKFADLMISKLDADHVESLVDTFRDEDYSPDTIRLFLSIIQRSWVKATRKTAAESPVRAATNRPSVGKGRERRLIKETINGETVEVEEQKLLEAADSDFGHIIRFALLTCARRGEIFNLQWTDINLPGRSALVRETKNQEPRTLPLGPSAIDLLNALVRPLHGGPVFKATSPDAITNEFARCCQKAGSQDLRFHDLRHEAISRLFERTNFTDLEISSITGHKTLQMLKRYTHLRTAHLADRLAEAERRGNVRW